MRRLLSTKSGTTLKPRRRPSILCRVLAIASLMLATMLVPSMAEAQYQLRSLVSNQVKQAAHTDPLLVNAWGLVHGLDSYGRKWAGLADRIERAGLADGNCF